MDGSKSDWLKTLEKDGYVVIPGVVSEEDCEAFQESAWKWLESFPWGFKRDDRSTWVADKLPYSVTGGLYNRYAVNHEDCVWKIRSQPGIIKIFQELWGTEDLIASFDGMNASLPINEKTGRTDLKITKAWPHIDQNPRRVDRFELYQGIANLAPNGRDDGGLCVLRGSHLMHQKHFDDIGGFSAEGDAGEKENGYTLSDGEDDWYKQHGCEAVKICAGKGDLILWDSRTVHWNASPIGNQTRFVTYVCYCPKSMASEETLKGKKEVFDGRKGTTHWPNRNLVPAERPGYHNALPRRPDGELDPHNRTRPLNEPEETAEVLRLVGVTA